MSFKPKDSPFIGNIVNKSIIDELENISNNVILPTKILMTQ